MTHFDIEKIQSNPQDTIEKTKRAVLLLMEASDILEEAGIVAISRDALFLAKSSAQFINDLEREITKSTDTIAKISEDKYEEMLSAIKNIKIED